MTPGTNVKVNCPVYRNGKTLYGVVTGVKKEGTLFVRINGNSKSTSFSLAWIKNIEVN